MLWNIVNLQLCETQAHHSVEDMHSRQRTKYILSRDNDFVVMTMSVAQQHRTVMITQWRHLLSAKQ